jgi:hypothetical protein
MPRHALSGVAKSRPFGAAATRDLRAMSACDMEYCSQQRGHRHEASPRLLPISPAAVFLLLLLLVFSQLAAASEPDPSTITLLLTCVVPLLRTGVAVRAPNCSALSANMVEMVDLAAIPGVSRRLSVTRGRGRARVPGATQRFIC